MTGSMKRMPYPSYPAEATTRPWSPLSHSTSFEYNRPATLPKSDAPPHHVSPAKLISTTSTPANLLLADLANPWREVDAVDGHASTSPRPSHLQQFEMFEKPSKLKLLSDAVYKFDDSTSRSTFYPERDLAGRVPWSYKRSRGADDVTKQKVKFEDYDYGDVALPNYKLHFATADDVEHRPRLSQLQHRMNGSGGGATSGTNSRNVPTKQFINTTNHRVSDSDGRKCEIIIIL